MIPRVAYHAPPLLGVGPLRQVNRRHLVHNQLRIAIGLIRQDDNSEVIIQISRRASRSPATARRAPLSGVLSATLQTTQIRTDLDWLVGILGSESL